MQATDMPATLLRALRVLAISPPNRSFILEAGALEPLTELLCTQATASVEPCLFAVSLLAREEDARLVCFPRPALTRLLQLLSDPEATPEIRATAAATLTSLSRSLHNRQAPATCVRLAAQTEWHRGLAVAHAASCCVVISTVNREQRVNLLCRVATS